MPRKMTGTFCETTKAPKSHFAPRSFRYIKRGSNWLLIGCPRGHWMARAQKCKVGTRAHKILRRTTKSRRCHAGERRLKK